jgi:hypothetical protein
VRRIAVLTTLEPGRFEVTWASGREETVEAQEAADWFAQVMLKRLDAPGNGIALRSLTPTRCEVWELEAPDFPPEIQRATH